MYTMYLALFVSAVASILWTRRCLKDRRETPYVDAGAGSFCCFVLFCIVGAIFGLVINANLPMQTVRGGPYELVAMRSADGISGGFIYSSGSINGVMMYRVIVKNDDGSMTAFQEPANDRARIFEDSSLHGEGKWKQITVSRDYSSLLGKWAIGGDYQTIYNTFTVPVGTVVQDFVVK